MNAMTVSTELELKSFVLLRLGDRRFAVAADQTAELVAPSRVFRFPHRTPKIEGVILRRGRIVPVCDVAEKLIGTILDRKSTRLNSSHRCNSYAVFCLKKKKTSYVAALAPRQ